MELTEDLERMKSGYAYVEMPTIILFTIPAASFSCLTTYEWRMAYAGGEKNSLKE